MISSSVTIFNCANGRSFPYRIRISTRAKYPGITVSPGDGVVLTLPALAVIQVDPLRFLEKNQTWVLRQLDKLPKPAPLPPDDAALPDKALQTPFDVLSPAATFTCADARTFNYRIRISTRAKHSRITVSPGDGVVLTVPAQGYNRADPLTFLEQKQFWILRQLDEMIGQQYPQDNQSHAPVQTPPAASFTCADGRTFNYSIRISTRAKSLGITISPRDGVVVTVPVRERLRADVVRFLDHNQTWVLNQLQRMPEPEPPPDDGAQIMFRGGFLTLRVMENKSVQTPRCQMVMDELFVLVPKGFAGDLKRPVRLWLARQTELETTASALEWAKIMGVQFSKLSVRNHHSKWGSCSRDGAVSFNWRLIMFPDPILQYIVVHELCHLRHFHHKPTFWKLVEKYMPDYKQHVKWLKENGLKAEAALM